MAEKLDLFWVLGRLDKNDFGLRDSLSDKPEQQKELDKNAGWVYPQWLTGSSASADHAKLIKRFNQSCNPGWYDLYKHPELQLKLLASIGLGRTIRHKFFKPYSAPSRDALYLFLLEHYPGINNEEIALWCRLNTHDDLHRIAEKAGVQQKDLETLLAQYDKVKGVVEK